MLCAVYAMCCGRNVNAKLCLVLVVVKKNTNLCASVASRSATLALYSSASSYFFLKEGPALDTLEKLSGSFDMAFIDADKENYLNYYEALLPIMRPGGLIVVDNVLWSGRVLTPKEPSDHAIHKFNQRVMHDHRVEKVMLTIRDGISLLRKR